MSIIKESRILTTKISCPECKTENQERAISCAKCGYPLDAADGKEEEKLFNKRYKINSLLSSGGHGETFLSYDIHLNKTSVIKKINREGLKNKKPAEKDKIIASLEKEAQVLAGLRHQSLPYVTDYFVEGDIFYLVMDYVEGKDLEMFLEEEGKGLSEKQVIEWAIQICRIVEYLHNLTPPVIHGDIKPVNVIIRSNDGSPVTVDFGTASLIAICTEEDLTGSEGYAPPEQYRGRQDERSDIYSTGATMYELLTGTLPEEPFKFAPLDEILPELGKDTVRIVGKCLRYKKEDRFQNITELKNQLLKNYQENFQQSPESSKKRKITEKGKAEKKTAPERPAKNIKVFIVDDDINIREPFEKIVSKFKGIEVVGTATNGKEAVEEITAMKEKPDIILMDIEMPFMDGIEATGIIKKKISSVKIIMLTAFLNETALLDCFNAGASGYILKNETSWEELEIFIRKSAEGKNPVSYTANTLLLKAVQDMKNSQE